jgi:DNA-binding MarR family transcriptional regulator
MKTMIGDDLSDFVGGILDADSCLRPSERLVLIALGTYASSTGVCWPAVGTLAADTGLDPSTVRRTIHSVEKRGLITVSVQRQGFRTNA